VSAGDFFESFYRKLTHKKKMSNSGVRFAPAHQILTLSKLILMDNCPPRLDFVLQPQGVCRKDLYVVEWVVTIEQKFNWTKVCCSYFNMSLSRDLRHFLHRLNEIFNEMICKSGVFKG
jgi:hypothetical protein